MTDSDKFDARAREHSVGIGQPQWETRKNARSGRGGKNGRVLIICTLILGLALPGLAAASLGKKRPPSTADSTAPETTITEGPAPSTRSSAQ